MIEDGFLKLTLWNQPPIKSGNPFLYYCYIHILRENATHTVKGTRTKNQLILISFASSGLKSFFKSSTLWEVKSLSCLPSKE